MHVVANRWYPVLDSGEVRSGAPLAARSAKLTGPSGRGGGMSVEFLGFTGPEIGVWVS